MNKTIFINWFQGWDNAPEVCGHCLKSWEYHNPDWEIVKLDNSNISEYCTLPDVQTNLANYSDILRVYLMKQYGGVWADSTLFCNKPLDSWIPECNDSFIFTRSDERMSDKIICNWFVYADKDSYLISELYDRTVKYWTDNPVQPQLTYWMHDLVRDMYRDDSKSKDIIDSWSHIDCATAPIGRGAHYFTPYEVHFGSKIQPSVKNRIDSKVDPIYKLTHKTPLVQGSALYYLFGSVL